MSTPDVTDRNLCRSSTLWRSERRAVRQRLSAYRRLIDKPSPETWEVLGVPWSAEVDADGVYRLRRRCWLFRHDPSGPWPAATELARRFSDGDPDVVEVWGEEDE